MQALVMGVNACGDYSSDLEKIGVSVSHKFKSRNGSICCCNVRSLDKLLKLMQASGHPIVLESGALPAALRMCATIPSRFFDKTTGTQKVLLITVYDDYLED